MTKTALFIERDATYVTIVRKLRGTMTREEWDQPAFRQAQITAHWQKALADIREWDATAEFITPLPVTLYVSPVTGAVTVADIGRESGKPIWITPLGMNLLAAPDLTHTVIRRTTYAHWAEGPLRHVELGLVDAPTPAHDPEIQRLRAQNSSVRKLIDDVLKNDASWDQAPRQWSPSDDLDLVDFRIRGVFRVKDFQPMDSKQATSAKLRVKDGVLDLNESGVAV